MSSAGVIIRLTAGALWLLVLAGIADVAGGSMRAFWWFVPAAAVWVVSVTRTRSGAQRRAYGGLWFLASLFGPLSLLLLRGAVSIQPAGTGTTLSSHNGGSRRE